ALERLAEVIDQLAGMPIPASVLERDVLPARVPGYQPRLLDELGAMGEVAWLGRGSLGRDDGRIVLVRPGREALRDAVLSPPGASGGSGANAGEVGEGRPGEPRHEAIREFLLRRGASFYRPIHAAAGGGPDRDVLDALWDLVWAGELTNDTFAPLRALRWSRPGREPRRRPGRLTSLGPPEAAGRWSLVDLAADAAPSSPTERLHALALVLLDRHGVLTREAVVGEGVTGGFSAIYPVLRALEDAGRIRRGYFVDGLGAAQFALAGALDGLRAVREVVDGAAPRRVHLLAAADPANAYGAALGWPRRSDADRRPFQRAAGAYVALVDGQATFYLERGGRSLQSFPAADEPRLAIPALRALATLVADRRVRELVITKVDGLPIAESPWRPALLEAGFQPGYRGLVIGS
ncbi:MAG: Lhr family helicase, partial [Candidatus Limnocylindrales bacterium]